jgi:hypothetical protein
MNSVERTEILDWVDFVDLFNEYVESDKYIFRGQSNEIKIIEPQKDHKNRIITTTTKEWNLQSSFNRHYNLTNSYRFKTLISQQLEENLFRSVYGNYEYVKEHKVADWNLLDKIMFLQHYGIPTCLIDFTKDPLIALYFAISSIRGSSGKTLDHEGNVFNYSDDCFTSVYQLDCELLQTLIGVKKVDYEKDLSLTYNDYKLNLSETLNQSAIISLILNPTSIKNNYNLIKQKGCFLLYDSKGLSFRSRNLADFISQYVEYNNIRITTPILKIYRISYNSIFTNRHYGELKKKGLFSYLKTKGISGAFLFNDLQGLKYDFNFFHDT